jgi:hypothetical protein
MTPLEEALDEAGMAFKVHAVIVLHGSVMGNFACLFGSGSGRKFGLTLTYVQDFANVFKWSGRKFGALTVD